MKASKGDWVRIQNTVLQPHERAPQVPEDTKATPLKMWVKGFAQTEGMIGDVIEVETITGRRVSGMLQEIKPTFRHSFGECVPEILQIGIGAKKVLFGGDK